MKSSLLNQLIETELHKARDLMSQGRSQEALVVALSALQNALEGLRDSLLTMQHHLGKARENLNRVKKSPEEDKSQELMTREPSSRYYH